MGNRAKFTNRGFICPVRGCEKKHNRLFSHLGLAMHLFSEHVGEFEKRLKLKEGKK